MASSGGARTWVLYVCPECGFVKDESVLGVDCPRCLTHLPFERVSVAPVGDIAEWIESHPVYGGGSLAERLRERFTDKGRRNGP